MGGGDGERAPGAVRRWAAGWLVGCGAEGVVEDAVTVLTELVTNAWQAGADRIAVLVEADAGVGVVRVCVRDDAPGVPCRREPGPWDGRGRGLLMVEALAVRWGHHPLASEAGRPGKAVWADLAWGRDGA
ncbi:ATP-binding protein [Thermomonospora amylolytica]|uniref:ATP-binding protein n=1 Tax=Thermomonospora amylolytica TaxID=1411117 RepID=UPI000E6D3EC8|nr:ATP-binding protein [Thermomonospora amylolytica]